MHFMSPADGFQVNGIGIPENLEPLVNEHIMDEEIGKTVNGNAQPDPEQIVESRIEPKPQAGNARRRKDHEEVIVLLEKIAVVALVVVMV